jgi:plastocyanin
MRSLAIGALITLITLVALSTARGAGAGTVRGTVRVIDAKGNPVSAAGAIVYLTGFTEEAPKEAATIEQRGRHFVPDLIAITAGQDVAFPNRDPFLHNVFSQSPVRRFDLGSYKKGQSKDKRFPTTGVVDVYCNIHPEMAATVLVVPNRRFARVGDDGTFTMTGVPPGRWTAFAYVRLAVRPGSAPVEVTDGGTATIELEVTRGNEVEHPNKFGEHYRDPSVYR